MITSSSGMNHFVNCLAALLLFVSYSCCMQAQHSDTRDAGLSKTLRGVVVNLYTFARTPDQPRWTPADRQRMEALMKEGQGWLVAQANRYDQAVKFMNVTYGPEGGIVLPHNAVTDSTESVGHTSFEMGFSVDVEAFAQSVYDIDEHDSPHVTAIQHVVFLRGPGRCYARSSVRKDNALETAVIFEQNSFGSPSLPVAYSHEVLHVYGVWDLYLADSQTGIAVTLAEHIVPKSIMADSFQPGVEVDQVTAWLIGWNDTPRWWYEAFEPRGREVEAVRQRCQQAGTAVKEVLTPAARRASEVGRQLLEGASDHVKSWWRDQ